MIVDSHCHIGLSWFEPVESLLDHLDRHDVERAVLVQSLGSLDNSYQAECVAKLPDRLASVVRVGAGPPDVVEALGAEARRGATGVRLRASYIGSEWMLRAAAELGLTVSCVGRPEEFAASSFAEVARRFGSLPIVIEHLAGLEPLSADYRPDLDDAIMGLGRLPNVHVKFHGLAEFARRVSDAEDGYPFEHPVPDLLARALGAFGAEQMLWGSDYPLACGREGYANALALPMRLLSGGSDRERELLFGGVAKRLYWT